MSSEGKSEGFSAVAIVIVTVVLVALGATGWYVAQPKNNKKETNNNTQQTNPTTSPKQKATDPSEGGKYLVIREWNVRVLLPDSLKSNVFYALREFDESYGHIEAADLNSTLFQPECRDTAGDLGLDVMRTTTPPSDTARYTHKENYWYGSIYGKDGCSKFLSGSKADVFNELHSSIGTIEPIN
jgi:hypothetical protein